MKSDVSVKMGVFCVITHEDKSTPIWARKYEIISDFTPCDLFLEKTDTSDSIDEKELLTYDITWEKFHKSKEYNHYPRGRVEVCNSTVNIYACKYITDNYSIMSEIENEIGLMDEPAIFHAIKISWITEDKYDNKSYLYDVENDRRFIDNNINHCDLVITNGDEGKYVCGLYRKGSNTIVSLICFNEDGKYLLVQAEKKQIPIVKNKPLARVICVICMPGEIIPPKLDNEVSKVYETIYKVN